MQSREHSLLKSWKKRMEHKTSFGSDTCWVYKLCFWEIDAIDCLLPQLVRETRLLWETSFRRGFNFVEWKLRALAWNRWIKHEKLNPGKVFHRTKLVKFTKYWEKLTIMSMFSSSTEVSDSWMVHVARGNLPGFETSSKTCLDSIVAAQKLSEKNPLWQKPWNPMVVSVLHNYLLIKQNDSIFRKGISAWWFANITGNHNFTEICCTVSQYWDVISV
jgi:hypothetical protein